MRLTGSESAVTLNKKVLGPQSGTASGGAIIETGELGNVGLTEMNLARTAGLAVRASSGTVKVEKATVNVSGDVILESGGTTKVKDNTITSPTKIRISGSGSCMWTPNTLLAPVVEPCL